MPASPGVPLADLVRQARPPLDQIQPAIRAFWQSYQGAARRRNRLRHQHEPTGGDDGGAGIQPAGTLDGGDDGGAGIQPAGTRTATDEAVLDRAAGYAAAWLIQSAYQSLRDTERITIRAVRMAQLARNILASRGDAVRGPLGC